MQRALFTFPFATLSIALGVVSGCGVRTPLGDILSGPRFTPDEDSGISTPIEVDASPAPPVFLDASPPSRDAGTDAAPDDDSGEENGTRTRTASTTQQCPKQKTLRSFVERTASRWQPMPNT